MPVNDISILLRKLRFYFLKNKQIVASNLMKLSLDSIMYFLFINGVVTYLLHIIASI